MKNTNLILNIRDFLNFFSQFTGNKINTLLIIKEDDDNDMMNLMIYVWFRFINNSEVQRFKSSFITTVFLILSVNFFWKHPPLFLFKKKYNNDCCKSFFSELGMCRAKCFGVYICRINVVVCQYLTILEPIYILNDTWSRFDMQISVLLLISNMLHFWLFVIVRKNLNVSCPVYVRIIAHNILLLNKTSFLWYILKSL